MDGLIESGTCTEKNSDGISLGCWEPCRIIGIGSSVNWGFEQGGYFAAVLEKGHELHLGLESIGGIGGGDSRIEGILCGSCG